MKAILLCAGFATRMYPLTKDRAKPLLPVGGKPIVEHLVDRAKARRAFERRVTAGGRRQLETIVAGDGGKVLVAHDLADADDACADR